MEVPYHIGIIPDGNRRWAKKKGLPVHKGHEEGAKRLEEVLRKCWELGVKEVSVFVISTENVEKRSENEKRFLFRLIDRYLKKLGSSKELEKYDVRVKVVGNKKLLPKYVVERIREVETKTKSRKERKLNLLIGYGFEWEMLEVLRKLRKQKRVTKENVRESLLVKTPLDLIIRTGGMKRLSNFLLLQASYAELYFTDKLWPDFTEKDLEVAIQWFSKQKRNFGR